MSTRIRWQCQCGKNGWMQATNLSLAGLVRKARSKHNCADPDITHVETEQEYERRRIQERTSR